MGKAVTTNIEDATLNSLFAECVRRCGAKPALRRKTVGGAYEDVSWQAYGDTVTRIGLGLIGLGIEPGDRVGILSNSCFEWVYADIAIMGAAAVTVPIYQNVRAEELAHILADSGSRVVFVEDARQLAKLASARKISPFDKLTAAIVFGSLTDAERVTVDGLRVMTLQELLATGAGDASSFIARAESVKPTDLATIIYTSGTTGTPKGVMLSHRNCCVQADATNKFFGLTGDDVVLSFLPLAHLIARTTSWRAILTGYLTVYAPLASALDDMKDVRPTAVLCPPRIYEKIHASLRQRVESSPPVTRRYLETALAWAEQVDERARAGLALSPSLEMKRWAAKRAVRVVGQWFGEMTGGRLRFLYSAGAPLSKPIAASFHARGIVITEGYGLTETSGGVHANRPERHKLGTVGEVIPPTVTKLAADGEILVKGPTVMMGYYNLPDESKATIDPDGWLRTGDIGETDADGFLSIVDRKKDLIKTSGGKYVAPQKIENLFRTIRGVSQVAVFGDGHRYCVALVTVDPETAAQIVREAGDEQAIGNAPAIAEHEAVKRAIFNGVAEKNQLLASYETIKHFRIVPEFSGADVTSTLKLMRRRVGEKHKSVLEEMFTETA
jgi:long-chain acyl-CoA synthetase